MNSQLEHSSTSSPRRNDYHTLHADPLQLGLAPPSPTYGSTVPIAPDDRDLDLNDERAPLESDPNSTSSSSSSYSSSSTPAASSFFQILVAGAGFTCDAYDLFVMNLVLQLLSFDYVESTGDESLLADAVLVGSIVGQLSFGAIADAIGRRSAFIATLSLLTLGASCSAISFPLGKLNIFESMSLSRFILGVGIGGEYPLAATVTSEASTVVAGRGRRIATVFSMQGIGSLFAPIVVLILLGIIGPGHVGVVWRLALGIGALPGFVMLYWRIQMKESTVYLQAAKEREAEAQRKRQAEQLVADGHKDSDDFDEMGISSSPLTGSPGLSSSASSSSSSSSSGAASRKPFWQTLATRINNYTAIRTEWRTHWRDLVGTTGSWLIFDVVFYANGLFSSSIMSHWYLKPTTDPSQRDYAAIHSYLLSIGLATFYLGLCALPGYWCSIWLIELLGRRKLQMLGYIGMIVSYTLCGILLPYLNEFKTAFFLLYGVTFFFCNAGPNVTTFVLPSELFPTNIRASAHGISAAAGKFGAVLGGALMPALLNRGVDDSQSSTEQSSRKEDNLTSVMFLCAGISLFGLIWTMIWTRESQFLSLTADVKQTKEPSPNGIDAERQDDREDTDHTHHRRISDVPDL